MRDMLQRSTPRLRIGFLGGSHSHAFDKVRVAQQSGDWDLAGVWEDQPAVRARYEKAGVPLVSRESLLNDSTVQVIAVESDVPDHAVHARLALEAGKHVHLEKPPSTAMAEFRALVELAGRKKRLLQMGYMWRYNPAIHAAVEAGKKGWLGQVYLVRGTMNTLVNGERRQWARFPGGQMFEQGGHLIDPAVRLMGRPQKVTPILRDDGPQDDLLKDNTAVIFEWANAMGVITSATLQPNAHAYRSFEVFGSNGTAVVRPIEPPTLKVDLVKAAGPHKAGANDIQMPPYRRYEGEFADLAESVRSGTSLLFTPEEDLAVHEALLRASGMYS